MIPVVVLVTHIKPLDSYLGVNTTYFIHLCVKIWILIQMANIGLIGTLNAFHSDSRTWISYE